jgi:hypothetical protein
VLSPHVGARSDVDDEPSGVRSDAVDRDTEREPDSGGKAAVGEFCREVVR